MDFDTRHAVRAPWETTSTFRTTPESPDQPRSSRKRSPNRVRAKAADPAVISNIISSLEALTPVSTLPSSESLADSDSRLSPPQSPDDTVFSGASVSARSPGLGVGYGPTLALEDDDDDDSVSDAALPPTIPTSRRPSGRAYYTAPRSPAYGSSANGDGYFGILSTRRSSTISVNSAQSNSKNKLSAESWVRSKSRVDDTPELSRLEASRGRPGHKSEGRRTSRELLKPPHTLFRDSVVASPSISLAEQIIARSLTPLVPPRGRLFLRDSSYGEDRPVVAPPAPAPVDRSEDVLKETRGSESSPDIKRTPVRLSISKPASPISDSIPTRTSSLRQAGGSPGSSKRKEKKSKRPMMRSSMTDDGRSLSIPESSWADLGEDDETVRRIRELREQRKSRLQEITPFQSPDEASVPQNRLSTTLVAAGLPTATATGSIPRNQSKPPTIRATTEPAKAYKVLGLDDESLETQSPARNGIRPTVPEVKANAPVGSSGWSRVPPDVKRPSSAQYRPSTARSDKLASPSLSLDYSYAQAVDVLHDIESEMRMGKEHRAASKRNSLWLKGVDGSNGMNPAGPRPPTRTLSGKLTKAPLDRLASPSLRRRSLSSARHPRVIEEEIETARRSSIEDAAVDFLRAPRLSRTVRNASTGRLVAFSEVGDPDGAAVFVCVGMGLTRYVTAFYDELATTLRLRLITVDRPGVGGSEPLPSSDKSGPLNWPNDLIAICQELGITNFSLMAHSAGAVYALATALILPHMVRGKVHLLAPWIPPSQLEAISHPATSAPPAGALPRGQRFLRVLPTPLLKAANSSFLGASSASLKPASKRKASQTPPAKRGDTATSPSRGSEAGTNMESRPEYHRRESMMLMDRYMPDPMENFPIPVQEEDDLQAALRRGSLVLSATAMPTDPSFTFAATALNAAEHAERERQSAYTSRLTQLTWEMATRDSNPATDLLVCLERHREVGFRYTDVGRGVVITHGVEDKRVPLANVKWLAEQMNRHAASDPYRPGVSGSRDGWADASSKGGCEVRALAGEGHGLMAKPVIMADILTEIAGYWKRDKMHYAYL